MENSIEDSELIQRIRLGRQDDYAPLVRKYQVRVLRLCTALLGDPALAEDAAQEIFLKAYQALGSFRGTAAFSTWLYRISANHCKDLLRRRTRQRTESWEALLEEHGEQLQQLLRGPEDPRTTFTTVDLIDQVLSQLSPEYRLILTLRELEGLSYQELAETLQCSVDAVKARLRRARQELRDRLRHFFDPADV